ncbi:recombinase family protein [Actinophytocola glycyrrhizae]|uniref:Recombinase family protein n=1 Tax=Actinophytocola glycyrrhizae TaxID=2044873 RepID=A0ABV9S661_9PSEU
MAVNGASKITTEHRARSAVVYVRQSTVMQVREHAESTARQYGLSAVAVELGWTAEQVIVVDADLGVSGRFGSERDGFREMISRVCLGEVGAIFGLEVSRLARSSAEFARLLELARLADTLLIDGDGSTTWATSTIACCWGSGDRCRRPSSTCSPAACTARNWPPRIEASCAPSSRAGSSTTSTIRW